MLKLRHMTTNQEPIYRVIFVQDTEIYELYSRSLSEETLIGFIEVSELVFPQQSKLVIDPAEERLQYEFKNVDRCYVPMHNVLRIDEVQEEGVPTIKPADGKNNIRVLPNKISKNKG